MEHELIVEIYRAGNADKRLALFFYYRELREEFALLEERILDGLKPPLYQSWLRRLIPIP